ncbi:MoaD family protein [Candidatus Bipolaricaulota bacterium]|nr:MoaD family protein [Candidatus Bipolaricaulota bacterium]
MRVEVHLYFPFRDEVGESPVVLTLPPGTDVAGAVAALAARYPTLNARLFDAAGRVHRHISALVNGTSVQFKQGFATPLADGDVLTLLPPVGGG